MSPREVEYAVAYQIGALQGIAAGFDMRVTHDEPQGALNNMAHEDADYAGRIIAAASKPAMTGRISDAPIRCRVNWVPMVGISQTITR